MSFKVFFRRGLLLAVLALAPAAAQAQTQPLTIFAAASLTNALRDVNAAWQKQGHPAFRAVLGSSSTLARQIEEGAPANLFASADLKWMDYLAARKLIVPETRRSLLGNTLVLIVPADNKVTVTIRPGFDLMKLLGKDGRIATGDPAHVPVGIYAEQALKKLGLWQQAKPRIAAAEDVRGALLLVERAEAPVGIVYSTDAAVSRQVRIAGTFPADSHPPIVYPFAVVKGGDSPAARQLMQFLAGPEASAIFARCGFKVGG